MYEKGTNVSRGFGYVTFSNEKDAEEAIKGVDGMVSRHQAVIYMHVRYL